MQFMSTKLHAVSPEGYGISELSSDQSSNGFQLLPGSLAKLDLQSYFSLLVFASD